MHRAEQAAYRVRWLGLLGIGAVLASVGPSARPGEFGSTTLVVLTTATFLLSMWGATALLISQDRAAVRRATAVALALAWCHLLVFTALQPKEIPTLRTVLGLINTLQLWTVGIMAWSAIAVCREARFDRAARVLRWLALSWVLIYAVALTVVHMVPLHHLQNLRPLLGPAGVLLFVPPLLFIMFHAALPASSGGSSWCKACGFDLTGLRDEVCPECGRPFSEASPDETARSPPEEVDQRRHFTIPQGVLGLLIACIAFYLTPGKAVFMKPAWLLSREATVAYGDSDRQFDGAPSARAELLARMTSDRFSPTTAARIVDHILEMQQDPWNVFAGWPAVFRAAHQSGHVTSEQRRRFVRQSVMCIVTLPDQVRTGDALPMSLGIEWRGLESPVPGLIPDNRLLRITSAEPTSIRLNETEVLRPRATDSTRHLWRFEGEHTIANATVKPGETEVTITVSLAIQPTLSQQSDLGDLLGEIDANWHAVITRRLTVTDPTEPTPTTRTPPDLLTQIVNNISISKHSSDTSISISMIGGSSTSSDVPHPLVADLFALIDDEAFYIGTECFIQIGTRTKTRLGGRHALPEAFLRRINAPDGRSRTPFDVIIRPNPANAERFILPDAPVWDGPEAVVPVRIW